MINARSMEEAKALAMLEGHGLAGRHIEKPMIVESDCSQMVQGWKQTKNDVSTLLGFV